MSFPNCTDHLSAKRHATGFTVCISIPHFFRILGSLSICTSNRCGFWLWCTLLRLFRSSYLKTDNRKETIISTGRFIMFSVIINIYNKKNRRTYLNEIFHSHRKTEKVFFLTTRDVRRVHHGWNGTHRTSLVVKKKKFFSFPVAVKNSIKVGPLVFLW